MVDIVDVSAVVAAAGVIAGVVYYALEMREQTRIRKTDLIIMLYSKLRSPEFKKAMRTFLNLQFKDYDDFVKKYGEPYSKTDVVGSWQSVSEVGGFFELIGTLLYKGYIDLQLVYDVFGVSVIKRVYDKSQPLIVGTRKATHEPVLGSGTVYLHNELMRKEPQLRKTWMKASLLPVTDSRLPNEPLGDTNG